MKTVRVPEAYNYIGMFLTFGCNLSCSYCINNFEHDLLRRKITPGKEWVKYINRIESPPDLPVTLQGGEPSIHPDFFYIINNIKPELNIDILTNLQFDLDEFTKKVDPERVKRDAPYASIRVSYHPETMDLDDILKKTLKMQKAGFSIGIWSVLHPTVQEHVREARKKGVDMGIDFRTKEFLGEYNGKLHGTYKYPGACEMKFKKKVLCKTSEFLTDPEGSIFRCHHDIYKGVNSIGNLFDPEYELQDIYSECDYFGYCNPCDIKIKTNRFQEFGHTSVDVRFDAEK